MANRPVKTKAEGAGGTRGAGFEGGPAPAAPYAYRPYSPEELAADPELWWKERQRQLRASASWSPIVKTKKRAEDSASPYVKGPQGMSGMAGGGITIGELPAHGGAGRPNRPSAPGAEPARQLGTAYAPGEDAFSVSRRGGDAGGGFAAGGGSAPTAPWYSDPVGPGPGAGRRPPDYGERGMLARLRAGLLARAAVALLLYGLAWGWLRADLPGSDEARGWMTLAVTQDMDFSAAEAWYGRIFDDSPSFLPVFRHGETAAEEVTAQWDGQETIVPIQGEVVETFKQNGTGVKIRAAAGSPVTAVHSGKIMQVTSSSRGDATILVQHAGRIVTVYGGVSAAAVRVDDWVEAGDRLGVLGKATDPGEGDRTLYFAVRLGGQTLDPQEVIPFD